jgi:hypothetical protein
MQLSIQNIEESYMSEGSNTNGENQTVKENQTTLDAEKLAATNARLLKESQEWKEKFKQSLKEKEDLEAQKLAETGDKDAIIVAERKAKEKALEELNKTKKKVISQALKDKVAKYAGEVYSIDDIVNRPQIKEYFREGIDEEALDFSDDVAKKFVEAVKKDAPYLWKQGGSVGANTSRPGVTNNAGKVDTSKMTASELKEYIKNTFK